MAKPAQFTLSEQRVHCGEAGTGKNLSIGHFVPPSGAKDAAKTLLVETVHFLLLLGIGCPGFTSLQEGADYACVIHYYLNWSGQFGVLPDVSDQLSLGSCDLVDGFVDFSIYGQVVADGGTKVGELVYHFKFRGKVAVIHRGE